MFNNCYISFQQLQLLTELNFRTKQKECWTTPRHWDCLQIPLRITEQINHIPAKLAADVLMLGDILFWEINRKDKVTWSHIVQHWADIMTGVTGDTGHTSSHRPGSGTAGPGCSFSSPVRAAPHPHPDRSFIDIDTAHYAPRLSVKKEF